MDKSLKVGEDEEATFVEASKRGKLLPIYSLVVFLP